MFLFVFFLLCLLCFILDLLIYCLLVKREFKVYYVCRIWNSIVLVDVWRWIKISGVELLICWDLLICYVLVLYNVRGEMVYRWMFSMVYLVICRYVFIVNL